MQIRAARLRATAKLRILMLEDIPEIRVFSITKFNSIPVQYLYGQQNFIKLSSFQPYVGNKI